MKRVGVLALQGDFEAHERALAVAGAETIQVRTAKDLEKIGGLILPGGESTTMLKLLREENLLEPLREFGRKHPIFGTCAGAILLASEVSRPEQESLALMDMSIERNGYGRQLDSRVVKLSPEEEFGKRAGGGELEAVFIRAPIIKKAASGVSVLIRYLDSPVLVEQGRHLACTFHPELTSDCRVHKLFLEKL